MDVSIKLKSKGLRHGKIHKYEEVINTKMTTRITNIFKSQTWEMDYTQPSRGRDALDVLTALHLWLVLSGGRNMNRNHIVAWRHVIFTSV